MLPHSGHQNYINGATVQSGVFPRFYPQMLSQDRMPYGMQPVFNQVTQQFQQNEPRVKPPTQQEKNKKQLKNFYNFSKSNAKNADDMIQSIIIDSKSLTTDKSRNMKEVSANFNNHFSSSNNNGNLLTTITDANNFRYFSHPTNQQQYTDSSQLVMAHSSNISQGHLNATAVGVFTTTADNNCDDDFGDFVSTELQSQPKPIFASKDEISFALQPPTQGLVPAAANTKSPLMTCSSPILLANMDTEFDDHQSMLNLYGIQMPKWITDKRLVPELYQTVLASVVKNGEIDNQLVYSELLKSGLSKEILGSLWDLCNRKIRGRLNRQELFLMLAMISVCQNKLGHSSLAILSKCPQAPIPDLSFSASVSASEGSTKSISIPTTAADLSSHIPVPHVASTWSSTLNTFPSISPLPPVQSSDRDVFCNDESDKKVAQANSAVAPISNSTVRPPNNADHQLIHSLANFGKSMSKHEITAFRHHQGLKQHSKESIVCNKNNNNNNNKTSMNNNRKFATSEGDDDFDEFQAATVIADKLVSPLPIKSQNAPSQMPPAISKPTRTTASSYKSSTASTVNSSTRHTPTEVSNLPLPLSVTTSSPPTLLSLASPKMSSCVTSQMPSLLTFPTSQISSSPVAMLSDTLIPSSSAGEDRYAAFKELQSDDPIFGNDDDFGDFESSSLSGLCSTVTNSQIAPVHEHGDNLRDSTTSILDFKSSTHPASSSSQTFIDGFKIPAVKMSTSNHVNSTTSEPFAFSDKLQANTIDVFEKHVKPDNRKVCDNKTDSSCHLKGVSVTQSHQLTKHDWQDFLSLDKIEDSKSSALNSNFDDDDDGFEDFVSHPISVSESKMCDLKKGRTWSYNSVDFPDFIGSTTPISENNFQLFNDENKSKTFHDFHPLHAASLPISSLAQQHRDFGLIGAQSNFSNCDEKKQIFDVFSDGECSKQGKHLEPLVSGESASYLSSVMNDWAPQVDGRNSQEQSLRDKFRFGDDDNLSVQSLEFKVPKPHLSSSAMVDSLTPDDSQSTSSATDMEKKSADERSISSLDLPLGNHASSAAPNFNANNNVTSTVEFYPPAPSMTFFGGGKPLDAKDILSKVGGVVVADRYYNLTDHSQDLDSHSYQWSRCLKVVEGMLKRANETFSDVDDVELMGEIVCSEKGANYLKDLVEIFLVSVRTSYQMKASAICSEELGRLQESIDQEWSRLLSIIPQNLVEMPHLRLAEIDRNEHFCHQFLLESNDLGAYKKSCGLCLLCVLDTSSNPSSPLTPPPLLLTLSNTILNEKKWNVVRPTDRLEYGGRLYHSQCANFWINCVDLTLPSLVIPELI